MPKKRKDDERPTIDGQKQTVGALSQELLAKDPETTDAVELQREMQYSTFEEEFYTALDRAKKKYASDFYIVILNQRFRIFSNVIRTYFVDRLSCPTPDYDQAVYRFERKSERIEFLWVIPDINTCRDIYYGAFLMNPEHRQLFNFVSDFYDGTLLEKCKILNQEESQTHIIVNA